MSRNTYCCGSGDSLVPAPDLVLTSLPCLVSSFVVDGGGFAGDVDGGCAEYPKKSAMNKNNSRKTERIPAQV